jgi:hypothetical protein
MSSTQRSVKRLGGADVVAVVTFAGEQQDEVARVRELPGALRHALADAADDLGFRLTTGPSGLFPFAHLRNADDGQGHGGSLKKIPAAKAETPTLSCGGHHEGLSVRLELNLPAFAIDAFHELHRFGRVGGAHVRAVPFELLAGAHRHAAQQNDLGEIRRDVEVGIRRRPAFAPGNPFQMMPQSPFP